MISVVQAPLQNNDGSLAFVCRTSGRQGSMTGVVQAPFPEQQPVASICLSINSGPICDFCCSETFSRATTSHQTLFVQNGGGKGL